MKEKIKKLINNIENFWLKNLSWILITAFIIILWLWIFDKLSIEYTITSLWAIFAFWYWYKTYERNKELEIIEKYSQKYNNIKNEFSQSKKTLDDLDKYFNQLFNLWREEFYLYNKNYISKDLWLLWEIFIKNNIEKLLITVVKNDTYNSIMIKQILNEKVMIQFKFFNDYLKNIFDNIYWTNSQTMGFILNKHKELKVYTKVNFKEVFLKKDKIKLTEYINEVIDDIYKNKINVNNKISILNDIDDANLMDILESAFLVNGLIKYINNTKT